MFIQVKMTKIDLKCVFVFVVLLMCVCAVINMKLKLIVTFYMMHTFVYVYNKSMWGRGGAELMWAQAILQLNI